MILNLPTRQDFETVAKENLTQAFNLLFKVYETYEAWEDVQSEVPLEDIWEHHRGTLRTALVLIYQAIEGLMKGAVCDISPLLLIDKPRKDWPTLPTSDDKEFDSLYTIGGESLLNTFCAVNTGSAVSQDQIDFIEGIRQKRNQAMHGTNVNDVTPEYIIANFLSVFEYWFGKDIWFQELKANLLNNPLFGYFDSEYEEAISYKYLDFASSIVSKKRLAKSFSLNINGRAYFCPSCKYYIDKDYGQLKSKWAFLNPNQPASATLQCLNCKEVALVIRKDCQYEDCKGNVLFDDVDYQGSVMCLTCYEAQDPE